jgi:hypothetical protein
MASWLLKLCRNGGGPVVEVEEPDSPLIGGAPRAEPRGRRATGEPAASVRHPSLLTSQQPAHHKPRQRSLISSLQSATFSVRSFYSDEEETLDDLCEELEGAVHAFAARYKRAMRRGSDQESVQRAADSMKKATATLRALQRLRPNSTWGSGDGPAAPSETQQEWLSSYTGSRRRFKDLRSVVRKVQQQNLVVTHWVHQVKPNSRSGSGSQSWETLLPVSAPRVALKIDDWTSVDVFKLDAESQQRPLTEVFMTIWQDQRFDQMCKSTGDKVFSLMRAIEGSYLNNPYHNSMHAADVTQVAYYFWSRLASQEYMRSYFAEVDLLVLIVAAAIHDMAHPAVNNDFLIRTRDAVALQYNDRNVLENFHASSAFQLMAKHGINLLEQKQLGGPPQSALRGRVVDMVLATDMAQHKNTYQALEAELASHDNIQDIDKLVLEKNVLHMADMGHSMRPWAIHKEWSRRVLEETYMQGDREKALGFQPASFLFDRESSVSLAKGQVGFLSFVIKPCWKPLKAVLGEGGKEPEECLRGNLTSWESEVAEEEASGAAQPKR